MSALSVGHKGCNKLEKHESPTTCYSENGEHLTEM